MKEWRRRKKGLWERVGDVADDYEFHAGTCHSHIHAAQVSEENDLSGIIASHDFFPPYIAFAVGDAAL